MPLHPSREGATIQTDARCILHTLVQKDHGMRHCIHWRIQGGGSTRPWPLKARMGPSCPLDPQKSLFLFFEREFGSISKNSLLNPWSFQFWAYPRLGPGPEQCVNSQLPFSNYFVRMKLQFSSIPYSLSKGHDDRSVRLVELDQKDHELFRPWLGPRPKLPPP